MMLFFRRIACAALPTLVIVGCSSSTFTVATTDAGADSMPAHDAARSSDTGTRGGSDGGGSDAGTGGDAHGEGDSGKPDVVEGRDGGADSGDHDAGGHHDSGIDSGSSKDTGVEPGCPASPPSGLCSMAETCNYPTESCICSNDGMSASMLWNCSMLAAGCPQDPPMLGTACSPGGLVCDYGHCYGAEEVECTAGFWVTHVSGFCPG